MQGKLIRQCLYTVIPAALVLLLVALGAKWARTGLGPLTRDVAATADLHPLFGILSNLGILLWTASACICLFSARVLAHGRVDHRRFLVASGLLSAYLMIDDWFMFHEFLAPRYLGIKESQVFIVLGLAVLAYLWLFRRMLLAAHYVVLGLSIACLGASVGFDVLQRQLRMSGEVRHLLEDGAKWFGIALWCSFQVRTALDLVRDGQVVPATDDSPATASPAPTGS